MTTPQTNPEPGPPESIEELHEFLRKAVQVELSVIPPYLCGLYSMRPGGDNLESALILRSIVTEEMLHLTLAANVLMAVGGGPPTLASAETVLPYPILLAMERDLDPERQFLVHLLPFSPPALDMYLKIENPAHEHNAGLQAAIVAPEPTLLLSERFGFGTVGAFYEAIKTGLHNLTEKFGEDKVFSGDRSLQIEPQYYYAGGGGVRRVYGLDDALAAITEIVDQGEGAIHSLYDEDGDLAHYFRFKQVELRRQYKRGDKPDSPTGPPFEVDFEAVYPMKPDPRTADYDSEELRAASDACNRTWSELLRRLDSAFAGTDPAAKGEDLIAAVAQMLDLRDQASMLMRIPLPGGKHAGPTFEYLER